MKTNVGMIVVLLLLIVAAPIGGSQGIKAISEHRDMNEADVSSYVLHEPIIVENVDSSPDEPYVIEGYEIANLDGPGIQVRHVDYVVIRNNYIHDCGTNISEDIQEKITTGVGDARLATMDNPFDTGGIMVFNAKRVEISGNRVINSDYGIVVQEYGMRAEEVSIYDNIVEKSHRSFFIKVFNADNVDIYDNYVVDNGLGIFMDNKGLIEAFERGEDFGDGRSQGIFTEGSNHVRISGNTVINSSSDGIAVTNGELDFVEDIEISNNTVLKNGEQGIWIVSARNGQIYNNVVSENRHRVGETGGSNGIMFEGKVFNFRVFDNDIGYNDVFGILLISSSDNEIYNNDIHHNGDGAIGWGEQFYLEKRISSDTIIQGNNISHNRIAALNVKTDLLGLVTVENNVFTKNGGDPIHFEFYDDYDMTAHPEDWEYNETSVLLCLKNEEQIDQFNIGTNLVDGQQVTGTFNVEMETKEEEAPLDVEVETEEEEAPPESAIEGIEVPPVPTDEETTNEGPRVDEVSITVGITVAVVIVGLLVFFLVRRRAH